jgi:GNAT superfamily N-acetyltransferase
MQAHYGRLTGEDFEALHGKAVRLDEPHRDDADLACDGEDAWTIGARVGGQWVGIASVSPRQPPGPTMRGFFHIHRIAVRATERGEGCAMGLIERCMRHAASRGGRTVWCRVPLDTIDLWQRCGFAIAGPPSATRHADGNKRIWVIMLRQLALTCVKIA